MKIKNLLLSSLFFMGCQSNQEKSFEVGAKRELPSYLREVSGLTAIDDNLLAMVQDEKGIIFIYDITSNEIVNEYTLSKDGDYEGVEFYNHMFYALESDGTITRLTLDGEEERYRTNVLTEKNDTEGICYSPVHNGLLVLCKESGGNGLNKNIKAIYLFDLETKTYLPEPIVTIDLKSFLKKKKRKLFKPHSLLS